MKQGLLMQTTSFIVIYHHHGYDRKQSPSAQRALENTEESQRDSKRYA